MPFWSTARLRAYTQLDKEVRWLGVKGDKGGTALTGWVTKQRCRDGVFKQASVVHGQDAKALSGKRLCPSTLSVTSDCLPPMTARKSKSNAPQMTDAQRTQIIRQQVSALGDAARARHPWLAHQNAIGLAIQLGAIAGMGLCSWLYLTGSLPWWGAIPLIGILASLTHEIEHDLIHLLYFKNRPWVQHALLLLGWLSRPSTVNPWVRRQMHFHHHKKSGHSSDFEERAITNGEPWGLKRFLMTADSMLSIVLRPLTMRKVVREYIREAEKPRNRAEWRAASLRKLLSFMPLGHAFWAAWHAFVLFHVVDLGASWLGQPVAWPPEVLSAMSVLNAVTVCLIAPNIVRNFSLHFISSNMHYYGNVEPGNVLQQTQVLNHPLFWPLQLFCFNFGATHAIHHFVVGQPFYLRQMIASEALPILRSHGVIFNDLGTFGRANRLAQAHTTSATSRKAEQPVAAAA